jgi:hypothetical protein
VVAPRRNKRNNALERSAVVGCGIRGDINGKGKDFRPSPPGHPTVARADCDRESSHEHALASAHHTKVLG